MNRYFDIALNLASERFSGERDKVIADALTRNVNYFNIVCSSLNELDFVKDLNDRYRQNSCFTLGVHPHNANELNRNTLKSLKGYIKIHQPSAVGETGLDFFRNLSSYENQINAFEQQIIISIENNLPLFLHQREAHDDFIRIIKELETTGTFKLKKNDLREEAYHLDKIKGDQIYIKKPGNSSYEVLDKSYYDIIISGEAGF